jgi:hypothetical protein
MNEKQNPRSLHRAETLWARDKQPEIAFTFDEPKTDHGAGLMWQEINERILAALAKHRIKAVLFVTGKRVDSEAGRRLVAAWDQAGHAMGNHSYSHLFFNDAAITGFQRLNGARDLGVPPAYPCLREPALRFTVPNGVLKLTNEVTLVR